MSDKVTLIICQVCGQSVEIHDPEAEVLVPANHLDGQGKYCSGSGCQGEDELDERELYTGLYLITANCAICGWRGQINEQYQGYHYVEEDPPEPTEKQIDRMKERGERRLQERHDGAGKCTAVIVAL